MQSLCSYDNEKMWSSLIYFPNSWCTYSLSSDTSKIFWRKMSWNLGSENKQKNRYISSAFFVLCCDRVSNECLSTKLKNFSLNLLFWQKCHFQEKETCSRNIFWTIKEHFFHLSTGNWLKVKITKLTYIVTIQASSDLLVVSNITHILLSWLVKIHIYSDFHMELFNSKVHSQ